MPAETVFLTGASGFIAKHIVLKLLNAGFHVVGSVRSMSRGDEVRAAVAGHLDDAVALEERLRFVVLDLAQDAGWQEALNGTDVLMHTASPFPMSAPENEDEVIRPAVDGTLRALRAAQAAGISRVVLTSSCVAVMNCDLPAGQASYREADWTDLSSPLANAYVKSKTLAERAAWQFVKDEAPEMALSVINPGLVLGPPLDGNFGTSVQLVERLLKAKDPMLPRFGFPIVDVRDVAEMHLRAASRDGAAGKRFIAADRFLWFHELADAFKLAYPDRKIVTRRAPSFLVRLMAVFDRSIRVILPTLDVAMPVSNARAREVLGLEFIDAVDSARATADYLIANRSV